MFRKEADFEAFERVMVLDARAAANPHSLVLCFVQPLALCCVA